MKEGILKELRLENHISQKAFSKQLGVSQQTIASWETGRTEPSNELLKAIADYFNVTTDYLLGRETKYNVKPLSNEQVSLLSQFNELGSDGQNLLKGLIESLVMTHAKTTITQRGNGNNILNVGGNNSVTVM